MNLPNISRESAGPAVVSRRRLEGEHGARCGGESGYVLALVALMILPIMAFTAFAVDLGAYYGRAAQMQRSTDASALSAVQQLPNTSAALTEAQAVAAKNGLVHGTGGITVTGQAISGSTLKYKVTINEPSTRQYFSKALGRTTQVISRSATAELIKPVSMGSPRNYIGTGNINMGGGTTPLNYWLAASGWCASRENGDRLLAGTDANYDTAGTNGGGNWQRCPTGSGVVANPEYSSAGYYYAVEFAQNFTGSVVVEVYDAANCPGGSGASGATGDSGSTFTTTFQMKNNDSVDPATATNLGTALGADAGECDGNTPDYEGQWATVRTLVNPTKGTYFVQVTTPAGAPATDTRHGSNSFALRARYTSTWTPCTTDATDTTAGLYNANCPNVYAYNHLGVYANLTGTAPSFYLASLGPQHNNKFVEITLFDPGEGNRAIQILDPLGNPVSFNWEVLCWNGTPAAGCADTAPLGGWTGTSGSVTVPSGTANPAIDTWGNSSSGSNPQPGSRRGSTSKYSDRLLKLSFQLPADISAAYSGAYWWRIRYYTDTGASTDRTTWTVVVKGSPLRLVP